MLRIINLAFTSPGSGLMWFALVVSLVFIGWIPAIVLHMRSKVKGLLVAFSIASIPLLIGVLGCVWSLLLMHSALPNIQESQRKGAYEIGVELSLANIWVTVFLTILLALLVWGSNTFAIQLQNSKNSQSSKAMRITRPLYQILRAGYHIVVKTIMTLKNRKYIILVIMIYIGASLVYSRIVTLNQIDDKLFDQLFYNTDLKITNFLNDIKPDLLINDHNELLEGFENKSNVFRSRFVYSGDNRNERYLKLISYAFLLVGILFILFGILSINGRKTIYRIVTILSIAFIIILILYQFAPIFFFYPIFSIETEIASNLPKYIEKDLPLSFPVFSKALFNFSQIISFLSYFLPVGVLLILLNRRSVEIKHNHTTSSEAR